MLINKKNIIIINKFFKIKGVIEDKDIIKDRIII